MTTQKQKVSARNRLDKMRKAPVVVGLRLKRNDNGTFTDQYGRILAEYKNENGALDIKPVGIDPQGASH